MGRCVLPECCTAALHLAELLAGCLCFSCLSSHLSLPTRSFAEERRRWPATARANWRELRRRLLGFKRRLRAELGESESESEDAADVAARFGMQKVSAAQAVLLGFLSHTAVACS